jgi:2OG-Fe(II) oxygenase superfamily
VSYYQTQSNLFSISYLRKLRDRVLASPYFAVNNLNRDFIGTKGFSVVFTRDNFEQVFREFPVFQRYVEKAFLEDCNAFYLNPLLLQGGSRVDPHIDRSLRSYCKTIDPPAMVSVLYVEVPADLVGGELVLRDRKRQIGEIKPQENLLLHFQGDLTHSVKAVQTQKGRRLSLVCEQYRLEPRELSEIPGFTVESRAAYAKRA